MLDLFATFLSLEIIPLPLLLILILFESILLRSSQILEVTLYVLLTIRETGLSSTRSSKATAAALPESSKISSVNAGLVPAEYILFVIS